MPLYCYRTKSGRIVDRYFPATTTAPKKITVTAGVEAVRCYQAERVSGPSPSSDTWPMECIASGVNANQAGELRDFFAKSGVPTEVTSDGNPIYRNASHRRRALKARGFVDRSSYI